MIETDKRDIAIERFVDGSVCENRPERGGETQRTYVFGQGRPHGLHEPVHDDRREIQSERTDDWKRSRYRG